MVQGSLIAGCTFASATQSEKYFFQRFFRKKFLRGKIRVFYWLFASIKKKNAKSRIWRAKQHTRCRVEWYSRSRFANGRPRVHSPQAGDHLLGKKGPAAKKSHERYFFGSGNFFWARKIFRPTFFSFSFTRDLYAVVIDHKCVRVEFRRGVIGRGMPQ